LALSKDWGEASLAYACQFISQSRNADIFSEAVDAKPLFFRIYAVSCFCGAFGPAKTTKPIESPIQVRKSCSYTSRLMCLLVFLARIKSLQ
jgi:hypothetical protein